MIIWVARVSRVSADRTDSSRGERAKHILATDFFGRTSEECCGEGAATNKRGACASNPTDSSRCGGISVDSWLKTGGN